MFKNANFIRQRFVNGCVDNQLSRYYVLKDMIKNNYSKIIVFQDDVMLKNNFLQECNELLNSTVNLNFEVIWLGLHKYACFANFVPWNINEEYEKSYIDEKINENVCKLKNGINPCSLGYLISLEGAINYVKYLEEGNIYETTDNNWNKYLEDKNLFYYTNTILCTGNNNFVSSIFTKNRMARKKINNNKRLYYNILNSTKD